MYYTFISVCQFLQLGNPNVDIESYAKLPSDRRERIGTTFQKQTWQENSQCWPQGKTSIKECMCNKVWDSLATVSALQRKVTCTYVSAPIVLRLVAYKSTDLLQAPNPGDNSTRTILDSPKYTQIVIYDHITRRKT